MKILITGATGFIGKHVIDALQNLNITIVAAVRNTNNVQLVSSNKIILKNFDLHQQDGSLNLFDYFEQPDKLIHLAWEGLPNYKEPFHLERNLPAHQQFLSNLIRNGLQDVTVTGTCFEYGMQEGKLDEALESLPQNAYAKAKNSLRIFLQKLQHENKFELKWARLFYMYGAGQNPKSLTAQLDAALLRGDEVFNMSGGQQTRDFMAVTDVANNIVKLALQNEVTGVINIATNQPVTVRQFVSNYIQSKNKQIRLNLGFYPYPDFEPMHFWGDNSKLKSIK